MKKFIWKIGLIAAVTLTVASCLKDKEETTYPECAITSFGVGNITTYFTTKTYNGLYDSIYSRVIDGGTIGFNIDHVNGIIESVDSVVSWADISRVVPTITYSGYIYCKQRGWTDFYSFASGTDSVDFTQDVEFLVVSTDGQNSQTYKARLNKAVLTSDSLYWTDLSARGLTLSGAHRTVALGSTLYVFAESGGAPTVSSLQTDDDEAVWSTPKSLAGVSGTLDYRSVTVFDGQLWALTTDGYLYTSTAAQQGSTWTQASDRQLTRLLCADATYLYAYDGTEILATEDAQQWKGNGSKDMSSLPVAPVSGMAYPTSTNAEMEHVVMVGLTDPVGSTACVWYKVSSANANGNQLWELITASSNAKYGLTAREDLTMVRLGTRLMAFGGKNLADTEADDAYDNIYTSEDNGLTWHRQTKLLMLPEQVRNDVGHTLTAATVDNELWLVRSDGKVWRGMIGRIEK